MSSTIKLFLTCFRLIATSTWFILSVAFLSVLIASHTFAAFAGVTSAAIAMLTGVTTPLLESRMKQKQQNTELIQLRANRDLDEAVTHRLADDLNAERGNTTRLHAQLNAARQNMGHLQSENDRMRAIQNINFRGNPTHIKDAVADTVSRITTRTGRTATTNIASMPAESVPFYGAAIVVAATSVELDAACKTMKDMYELQIAIDPSSAVAEGRDEVCGMTVPTAEEIWDQVQDAPGLAWDKVSNLNPPELGEIRDRFSDYFEHWRR